MPWMVYEFIRIRKPFENTAASIKRIAHIVFRLIGLGNYKCYIKERRGGTP